MSWRKHLLPALTLGGIVIASATQTEAAHTLTAEWGYNQPYFTFLVTHSTFSFVFPIHLAILALIKPTPWRSHISDVRLVLADQLRLSPLAGWRDLMRIYARKIVWLTLLISISALAWFVAMLYSPALDVSAIYATSAFWAYFFSMWLLGEKLSRVTVGSIALAFAGVVVLSLDGLKEEEEGQVGRAFGDTVMLIGAIILGLYEVVYKMVLPESQGGVASSESSTLVDSYDPVPAEEFEQGEEESGTITPVDNDDAPSRTLKIKGSMIPLMPSPSTAARTINHYGNDNEADGEISTPLDVDTPHPHQHLPLHRFSGPPALPPALLSNFLTSCIGIATFLMGFPLIFVFDFLGWESFRWPAGEGVSSMTMWSTIAVVAMTGAAYNAGLMILIGIWGPTTSSVANLLTIGLVALLDAVVMAVMPSLRALVGVGMICAGFGILLWEGEG